MKNVVFSFIALCLFLLFSCSSEQDQDDQHQTPAVVQTQLINTGDWFVDYYSEKGEIQTNLFKDYTIQFKANNIMNLKKGTQVISGTWSLFPDSGRNKLTFIMPSNSIFSEWSEDWEVVLFQDRSLHLKHVSGGNGHLSELHLKR